MLAFWLGLLVAMWLWWSDTPAGSVDGTGAALVEAGRITGMIAGYVLLTQILLMSRVGWLDRRVGANELHGWHRDLGGLLVVTVLAHVALITLGYASLEESSVLNETWALLTTYEDMVSAFVATGLLVGVGLLAIRAIRAIIPYELWCCVHLTSYGVLLLSYGHQFAVGQELAQPSFGRSFWIALYVFVLGCLAWGRVLGPLMLNVRHRLWVADVVSEGHGMFSVYVRGRRASSPNDLIFREELDRLAESRDADVFYVVGSRHDPGPRRVMTPKGMRRLVPDIGRRDVYLCGPEGLVSAAVKILERLRVPRRQIHLDPFEF